MRYKIFGVIVGKTDLFGLRVLSILARSCALRVFQGSSVARVNEASFGPAMIWVS